MSSVEEFQESIRRIGEALIASKNDYFPALTEREAQEVYETLRDEEQRMIEVAREEYSSGVNVFANFNRAAERLGISPEKVLMVYLLKHMDGVISWVNGREETREGIEDRIKDLRNYLGLLYQMVIARELEKLSISPEGLAEELPDEPQSPVSGV